jgi:predicted helicase
MNSRTIKDNYGLSKGGAHRHYADNHNTNDPDFTRRNVIAAEIEKVIQALTSRAFNRGEFLNSLDRFYVAIENAARNLDDWTEKQHFLNTVYERFFQGFSIKQADTHGIVYTPQEIVDFMCTSVDEVLKQEFHSSLSESGVQVLDPCIGTGNFIVNLIQRIKGSELSYKYTNDFFCNEIMLLPYYIASLNIEHAYYECMKQYKPFEGICFADTLELAEGQQLSMFVEENTERVQREKDAQIMVVIGNPPYNARQKNDNDNNKNRLYPVIDGRIRETYGKDSKATLKNQLYDAYVKFFRWATDRNYSATFLRYSSRSNFRVSSTSATVWGETRPVSPIQVKNFLNEARYPFTLATEAHNALRGNQSAKNQ